MDFSKSQTKINLARSFASECQEGARYQFLAMTAKQDYLCYIESLMKGIAKNEMSHARVFYNHIINHSNGTTENIEITAGYPFPECSLKTGFFEMAKHELQVHENIYPSFERIARDEGFEDIAESFKLVASVERCHYLMLKEIGEKYKSNKLYKSPTAVKWKCDQCGYEETAKSPWKTCPLCRYEQGHVMLQLSSN